MGWLTNFDTEDVKKYLGLKQLDDFLWNGKQEVKYLRSELRQTIKIGLNKSYKHGPYCLSVFLPHMLLTWVKVFRIILEIRILRLSCHRKSALKSRIEQILIASLIYF